MCEVLNILWACNFHPISEIISTHTTIHWYDNLSFPPIIFPFCFSEKISSWLPLVASTCTMWCHNSDWYSKVYFSPLYYCCCLTIAILGFRLLSMMLNAVHCCHNAECLPCFIPMYCSFCHVNCCHMLRYCVNLFMSMSSKKKSRYRKNCSMFFTQ